MLDNVPGARSDARKRASSRLARSIQLAGLEAHAAARCTSPTPPTRRARCCSTSQTRRLGRRAAGTVRRAARDAAGGALVERSLWRMTSGRRAARRHPDRRHRGRSAGGAVRAGVLEAGHGEEHLRHRLLHADEHGSRAGGVEAIMLLHDGWRGSWRRSTEYALEGSVFIAGAVVQWLRDGLASSKSSDVEALAAQCRRITAASIFVPAFAGLGRAALGRIGARGDRGPHARHHERASRAGGARGHRVSSRGSCSRR